MKPLLLTIIVAALVTCTPTSFERIVGGPGFDRGVYVSPTGDGGYVAVGVTSSFGEGNEDIYLVKVDASGDLQWTRTFGGPGDDNGWAVHEHGERLVLAGFTDSFGAGDFDCYLAVTDLDGDLQWSTTFGGAGSDRCWGVLPVGDTGYVLVGETTSSGSGAQDCYLIMTDASGNELWSKTYGGEEGDRCFSIAQAADGGFVLTG